MKISKDSRQTARQIVRLSMTNGALDRAKLDSAIDLVIEKKPRGYVGTLHALERFVRLELERRHALIQSAVPLEKPVQEQIKKELLQRHGADLTTEFQVNPNLIAGLRIQIGSDVWDGSVRSRLDKLEEELA